MIYDGLIIFIILFSALYCFSNQTPYTTVLGFFLLTQSFLYILFNSLTHGISNTSIPLIIAFGLLIGPCLFILILKILPSISKENKDF